MKVYTCEKDILVDGEVVIPKGKTIVYVTKEDLIDAPITGGALIPKEIKKLQCHVVQIEAKVKEGEIAIGAKILTKPKKKLTPLQRQQEKERKDNRPWYMKFKR